MEKWFRPGTTSICTMSEGKRGFAALEGMPKEIAEQHEAAIKKA